MIRGVMFGSPILAPVALGACAREQAILRGRVVSVAHGHGKGKATTIRLKLKKFIIEYKPNASGKRFKGRNKNRCS
jgi:hypothetical protein